MAEEDIEKIYVLLMELLVWPRGSIHEVNTCDIIMKIYELFSS